MKHINKRLAVLLLLSLIAGLTGCTKQPEEEEAPAVQEAIAAQETPVVYYAALEAKTKTKVYASGKGKVEYCPFEVGDVVAAGTLLYRLEDNGIADSIKTTENALKKSDITIQTARDNVANLKVYAPSDGILKDFDIKVGERVNASTLGRVVDESKAVALIPFTGEQKNNFQIGDTALITLPDYMTSVKGTVTRIYDERSSIYGGSTLYNVEVTLSGEGVASGLRADGKITNASGSYVSPVSGHIEESESVSVVSKGSGNATAVYARSGDAVKRGELLLEMENTSVTAQLDRAMLDRSDLQIKLASLKSDYNDLFVYAKEGGTIISMGKRLNDNILSSSDAVMELADISSLTLSLDIQKQDGESLSVGEAVPIEIDGEEATAYVARCERNIDARGEEAYYHVVLTLDNASSRFRDGAVASFRLGGDAQ